jgi:glycosyltransferase 2 family protein
MGFSKGVTQALIWSVVLAVALYAAAFVAADLAAVRSAAGRLGWDGWLLVLALSLVNYGLRFLRWHGYLRLLGERVPMGRHLLYYLAGFAFTTTPGKAGEAIRSLYLRGYGVSYPHSLAALFAERVLDVAAVLLLALGVVVLFAEFRWAVAALGLGVLLLLPLVHSEGLGRWLDGFRQGEGRLAALLGHIGVLLRASARLLSWRPIYGGLALGFIAWGAEGLAFWLILERLGVPLSPWVAAGIYGVGILAGAISFIPGGLGTTEGAMILLLGLLGADGATAVAATLICRVTTLWFAVGLGLLALGLAPVGARGVSAPNEG